MLLAGDEMGRTQGGNNNAYCQDNEISWIDWKFDDRRRSLLEFTKKLIAQGVPAVELHGNLSQGARTRNLEAFSDGSAKTLVATDIAARGIHVDDIGHVVNYDLPENADTYVHRVGRTGRAGRRGIAYTFVNETQRKDFEDIRRLAKVPFRRERLALQPSLVTATAGSPTAPGRRMAHTRRWARRPRGQS